jgi:predicted acetyltransferase
VELTVRPINEDEVAAFRRSISRGFGGDPKEEDDTRFRKAFELPRTVAAFDGSEIVGTGGAFSFRLSVPGGELPMGGTTIITVRPTHRRRGVLTAMMRAHLDEIRDRGEPLAGLWASETPIYGRFGYGSAAEGCKMELDGRTVEFLGDAPDGRVRLVDADDAAGPCRAVFERVRPTRPGMFTRNADWWTWNVLDDPEHWRKGRSMKRYAIYEGADGAEGYAIYRQKENWDAFPEGTVHVAEVIAATPAAHAALWRYLLRIDLFPNVEHWNLPVDDELPWRVTDGRRVRRWPMDSLWIRLLDIPRALTGRSYASAQKLVLGVVDPFLPENDGRYELDAGPDGATCRETTADADLEVPVDALGAMYLGGHRATTLARAGLISGEDSSLASADRLFAWPIAPWCHEIF